MNKTLLSISMALLLSASTYADPVTPSQALALAQQFVAHGMHGTQGKTNAKKAIASQPKLKLAYTATDSRLYAFNRGTSEGYVIVSGDDATAPVIGYSDHGSFDPDHMPDGMRYWLSECERQIAYAAQHPAAQHAANTGAPAGAALRSTATGEQDYAVIAPLVSTRWDQEEPYNLLTPEQDGKHCLTGCVATALAQVLAYHKYPDHATGTGLGAHKQQDLSQYSFDWANMLDLYTDGERKPIATATEEQRQNVARLMAAAGYGVDMDYKTSESGAYVFNVPFAAVQNFSMDSGAHVEMASCYDADTWQQMIYHDLATVGPIVYGGLLAGSSGHAFVCDGYAGNGYFHFNWGWSGRHDGNFLLTLLNPSHYNFSYGQQAVLGLQRPVAGSKPRYGIVYENPYLEIIQGNKLSGNFTYLTNRPAIFELALETRDETTGQVAYHAIGEEDVSAPKGIIYTRSLNTSVPDGRYDVRLVFRAKGSDDDYQPVSFQTGCNVSWRMEVHQGQQTFYNQQPYQLSSASADLSGKIVSQGKCTAAVTLVCNGGAHDLDLHAQVIDEQTQQVVAELPHVHKGISLTSMRSTINYPIALGQIDFTHTYTIVFYDGSDELCRLENKQATTSPQVEVVEPLSSPSVVGGKIWADTEEMRITAKLRNVNGNPVSMFYIDGVAYDDEGNQQLEFPKMYQKLSPRQEGDLIVIDGELEGLFEFFDFNVATVKFTLHVLSDGPDFVTTDGQPLVLSAQVVDYDPTTGIAHAKGGAGAKAISQLSLYTADGKLVKAYKGQASLHSLPAGIYIVRTVYADGSVEHAKVVKK